MKYLFTKINAFLVLVAISLIKSYRYLIRPILPPACRFIPTCSEYAQEALLEYGFFRGSVLAVKRILRCHPFCCGGIDEVIKCKNGKN
jgi:uncharacterized protein